jgi:hypothetical protein
MWDRLDGLCGTTRTSTPDIRGTYGPGLSSALLATVSVLQFLLNRSHWQAADSVRCRIDFQYALALVWENVNTHLTAGMRRYTADRERLTVVQLPPYALHLNPVDSLGSVLRRTCQANRAFADPDDRITAIRRASTDTTPSTAAAPAPDYANRHDDVTHSWSVIVGQGAKRAAYVLAVDALHVHAGKARHLGPVRDHLLAGRPTDGEADHAVGVVKAVLDDLSGSLHWMDVTEVHGEYQPELLTGERVGVILLLARIATGHGCKDAGTVVGESLVNSDPFDCRTHALPSGREA